MSAESVVATAAGVGAASVALVYDQNLAMASAGGLAMFLAVSATLPLQKRFFFSIGSFVLGYIVGLVCIASAANVKDPDSILRQLGTAAPLFAFASSAFASAVFGSLQKWADGGPKPRWISFFAKFLPFSMKKGDSE